MSRWKVTDFCMTWNLLQWTHKSTKVLAEVLITEMGLAHSQTRTQPSFSSAKAFPITVAHSSGFGELLELQAPRTYPRVSVLHRGCLLPPLAG